MNSAKTPEPDADFSALLAAYDAALAQDGSAQTNVEAPSGQMRARLESAESCLRLLHQERQRRKESQASRPRQPSGGDAAGAARPGPARPTFGRFQIIRELGRGGFGIVFHAYDPLLHREVALKVPHLDGLIEPEFHERFLKEARAAARLDHPNIVPTFETSKVGEITFIAVGYCSGPSLAVWLGTERRQPLSNRRAAALVAVLAEAVAYAHGQGVLHRDIKPGNVLLQPKAAGAKDGHPDDGLEFVPRLIDFGLASLADQDDGRRGQHEVLGTPGYMSPEQAAGRVDEIGPATDIYALGALLYEVLSGQPPHRGPTGRPTAAQVLSERPQRLGRLRADVPRDLEAICLHCLHKDPKRRYASAGDLAVDLRRFLDGQPVMARPVFAWTRGLKWVKRHRAVAALVMVSVLAVVGVIWHYYDVQPNEIERRLLYANTLVHVDNAVSRGELAEAKRLLAGLVPPPGKQELRGFEWYYFERVSRQSEKKWYEHAGGPTALAIAPDGQLAAVANTDREIVVWDVATSQRKSILRGHTNAVNALTTIDALAFGPDSKTLVSAQRGGEVMLWNAQLGETLDKLPPITGPLHAMALTADGTRLAFFSQGNRISVWDLPAGKEVFSCRVVGNVHGGIMAVSPSGKTVAVQEFTAGIELLDVTTGKVVQFVKNNMVTNSPAAMAFSPDERTFATAASDGSVQCWDVKTGKEVAAFHGSKDAVHCLAFAPGGRTLATGGKERMVRLWNLDHPTEKRAIRGAAGDISLIAFTPDGNALLSSGGEFVRWHPLVEPHILKGLDKEVWSVAFSPDSKMLATGTDKEKGDSNVAVKLWDVATGKELFGLPGHDALVTAVAFSLDGKTLATACYDGTLKLWDVTTQKARATLNGHTKLRAVAWSPDGKLLAAVGDDVTLRLWDAATGAALKPFAWPGKRRMRAVAFSPDGQTIVAGCEDGRLLFLHTETLKEQRNLRDESEIWCLAFSPDGKTLAMGNRLGQIRLLDGSTGEALRSCRGHTMGVNAVSFSPDGRTLASGSMDKSVKLWQVATGLELATLPEHGHQVNTVAFAPNGKTLASGSHNGVVKLWQAGPVPEAAWR